MNEDRINKKYKYSILNFDLPLNFLISELVSHWRN